MQVLPSGRKAKRLEIVEGWYRWVLAIPFTSPLTNKLPELFIHRYTPNQVLSLLNKQLEQDYPTGNLATEHVGIGLVYLFQSIGFRNQAI